MVGKVSWYAMHTLPMEIVKCKPSNRDFPEGTLQTVQLSTIETVQLSIHCRLFCFNPSNFCVPLISTADHHNPVSGHVHIMWTLSVIGILIGAIIELVANGIHWMQFFRRLKLGTKSRRLTALPVGSLGLQWNSSNRIARTSCDGMSSKLELLMLDFVGA